jgi:cytochrome c biogenesis protein ResB
MKSVSVPIGYGTYLTSHEPRALALILLMNIDDILGSILPADQGILRQPMAEYPKNITWLWQPLTGCLFGTFWFYLLALLLLMNGHCLTLSI